MIVVIEGSDLVGKTTVVDAAELLLNDFIAIHSNKIPEKINNDCFGKILSYNDGMMYKIFQKICRNTNVNFIIDRYIISELIYSKYTNRTPTETINDITNKDLYIIIITASDENLKKRYNHRGDERFKIEDIINLNKLFFLFYEENKSKLKNIYYFQNNNKKDLKEIIEFIRSLPNV